MKKMLVALGFIFGIVAMGSIVPLSSVYADSKDAVCAGAGVDCDKTDTAISDNVKSALRVFQIIIGVLAIFYMVYAGMKFITSSGSSDGVKTAKNTILYASIGLIIVILSEGIIQFVLRRFG